MLSGDG